MKKNPAFRRSLLSLLLAMAMLLSMVACGTDPATEPSKNMEGTTRPSTAPTTLPVTTPTTVPTTAPTIAPTTRPTEPPKPEKEPLVYTLIQEDVDLFYTLLTECETLSIAGVDMDAIEKANEALDEQYAYLNEQYSIINILQCCDIYDKDLKDQFLECVEICTQANDAYIQMARRIYLSDTPVKDELFEGWTDQDIAQLLSYDEEIAKLNARNEAITVEYRSAAKDSIAIALYIEFVQNNNKIAQFYGYDNYYDYAFDLVYDRDYAPEDLQLMRQYGKQYLASIFDTSMRNFYNTFYSLPQAEQSYVIDFLEKDYNKVAKPFVSLYMESLPESMAETMDQMLTMDSTFTSSRRAKAGAFTTMIGDRSYCYFGPGYGNCMTVIHEGGHYYSSRYASLNSIPLDLAEVHSQGNEWLFVHFLKDHMPSKQYTALVNYRLYNDITMTLIAMMVDEFEYLVYNTDVSNFDGEDFDALMNSVIEQYFDLDYANQNLTDINAYWRMVVVDQPAYYISYAVSAISAMDLYNMAQTDYDQALASYMQLCEEPVLDAGFLGNLEAVGLSGPFDEDFYIELVEIINSRK